MSELHSETNDIGLGLTVRVKLVDLNYTGSTSTLRNRGSSERVSRERLGAIVGLAADRGGRPLSADPQPLSPAEYANSELCMLTGERVAVPDFESHIETCSICANRVELQLDFMETLEVAVYQRRAEADSQKVRGAMLISTPELNFAVCGELELC